MAQKRRFLSILLVLTLVGCSETVDSTPVKQLNEVRDAELPRVEKMTASERDQSRVELRQKLDAVTPEQRREFFVANAKAFSQPLVRAVETVLALPSDKQQIELDRVINEAQAPDQSKSSATPPVDDARAAEMRNRVLSVLSEDERKTLDAYHAKLNERVKERGITTPVNFF